MPPYAVSRAMHDEMRRGYEDIIPEMPKTRTEENRPMDAVNGMIEIELRLLQYGLWRPDYTTVLYGRRRTGKSNAAINLLKALRPWYTEVYVFTGTKFDMEYERCVPDEFIFQEFREDVVEYLLERQKQRVIRMRERGENDENIFIMMVFDDVVTDDVLRTSLALKRVFFNGRHFYCGTIILAQDNKALTPALRANTDMAGIFRSRAERDKDAVRTNYIDFVKTDADIDDIMEEVSALAFNTLWVDQSRPYMRPQDTLYVAKFPQGKDLEPFFMGTRQFWANSTRQLEKYGGTEWLHREDWGIVNTTYKFKMTGME